MNWKTTSMAAAVALGIVGAAAYAQPFMQPVHGGYGPGQGSGMMGGPGFGGMGGYGMGGYGMGPGMMGGWGPGAGDWDDHMGPGMMGGYGYGPRSGLGELNLSDSQRQQVRRIQDETRRKNWELMGRMQDEMARQRDAWDGSKVDRTALSASNKRMFELRQQMLDNRLDAQEKIEGVLTPQQREQLDKR